MQARFVIATGLTLFLASSAQAQWHERFRERFREHGMRPFVVPEARPRVVDAPAPASVPARRRTGHESDATLCDSLDKDPDAAITACGKIIDKGQVKGGYSVAVAYTHRGQAFENKGDHDHAVADFSEAIRLKPTVAGYFALRAGAEDKSGAQDAARADFQKAASLDPKNQDALNGLKRIETRSAVSTAAAPAQSAITPVATIAAAAAVTAVVASASPTTPKDAAARTQPGATGARVALVIGNGAYVNANALPNPPNDAHAIAGMLRDIGFEVQEGVNLNRADMESQFREFLHRASNAGVVLLFYAGHGMQVDGRNYLVPVDAKLAQASDLPFETIEIDKLMEALGDPGHTNIILLDACRDNPLARSFASHLPAARSAAVAGGLAAYSAVGTGTLIAYATAPGQTALDGQGVDSPFTTSLLHNLKTPGLEIRQVLTRVRSEVAQATGNKQIPWDNSSLMGDVYLVAKDP